MQTLIPNEIQVVQCVKQLVTTLYLLKLVTTPDIDTSQMQALGDKFVKKNWEISTALFYDVSMFC